MGILRSWQGMALIVVVLAAAGAGLAWWLTRPAPASDPLGAWKQNGIITVGVRDGAAPFSALDESKSFAGYEPDIATALASALGVQPKFIGIDQSNGLDLLRRGVVDMVVMPRSHSGPDTAGIIAVQPGYFASGINAVALRAKGMRKWEDLKGKLVCGLQDNQPAQQIVDELGATYVGFNDRDTALQALAAERCAAFVNDETALTDALKSDGAGLFAMAFGTIDTVPWNIAVRSDDGALADFIAKQLTDYHARGFLIERAGVWQLPASPYLETMRQNTSSS